jgi:hypothetical protein
MSNDRVQVYVKKQFLFSNLFNIALHDKRQAPPLRRCSHACGWPDRVEVKLSPMQFGYIFPGGGDNCLNTENNPWQSLLLCKLCMLCNEPFCLLVQPNDGSLVQPKHVAVITKRKLCSTVHFLFHISPKATYLTRLSFPASLSFPNSLCVFPVYYPSY